MGHRGFGYVANHVIVTIILHCISDSFRDPIDFVERTAQGNGDNALARIISGGFPDMVSGGELVPKDGRQS